MLHAGEMGFRIKIERKKFKLLFYNFVIILDQNYFFIIQALSVKPLDQSLWMELGMLCVKHKNWYLAEWAFKETGDSLKVWEALILMFYRLKRYESQFLCG